MPIARMASSDALSIILIRLPERIRSPVLLGSNEILKKVGSAKKFTATRSISGKNNGFLTTLSKKPFADVLLDVIGFTSGNRCHDLILVEIVVLKFAYDLAVTHDYKTRTCTDHLVDLGGNKRYALSFCCKL